MKDSRFYELLSRKLAAEATIQELEELSDCMENRPDLKLFHDSMMARDKEEADEILSNPELGGLFAAHSVQMRLTGRFSDEKPGQSTNNELSAQRDNSVSAVASQPSNFAVIRYARRLMAVAASFLLLVFLGMWFSKNDKKDERITGSKTVNEVVTKRGNKSKVTLPDGTLVFLNADSKLTYKNFDGNNREVSLIGEAFFDVVKDSIHPFIIHADRMNIKVLGTAFNVKSYDGDDLIETALIHGKIEVTFSDRPSEKIILKPNEKLVIRKEPTASSKISAAGTIIPRVRVDTIIPQDSIYNETAWINNQLAFRNETLENIAREIERRFDIEIEFRDKELKEYRYTAPLQDEDVETILKFLSTSRKFNVQKDGKKYFLSR